MKEKINRNISLEYIFHFISNFSLTEAIWVLYLLYKGMSLCEIGLLEGVFHITSLVSEIPSGAAADRLGRAKVIFLGRICTILSSIMMLYCNDFWQFGLAFMFNAWGFNLISGSEEALIYDSFLYLNKEKDYYKMNGRLEVLIEIAQGLATFIGGLLSQISFQYCYVTTAVIALISLIPCGMFKEPEMEKVKKDRISLKEHFIVSFKVVKGNAEIVSILFFYSLFLTFYTSVYFYSQEYFKQLGLNRIQISLIMLLMGIVSCLGALASEHLEKICKEKLKYIATFVITAGIIGMGIGNIPFAIICFACMSFGNTVLYPLQSVSLNRLIPSKQRATIISVSSMTFSVFMIILFPFMGTIADRLGLQKVFLGTGGVGMIMLLGMILQKNDHFSFSGIYDRIKTFYKKG